MDVGHLWLAGQGFQVSNGSVSKMQTIVTYTSSLVFKEVGTSLGELAALDLFEGQCASFEVGSQGAGRALSRVAKGVNLPGLFGCGLSRHLNLCPHTSSVALLSGLNLTFWINNDHFNLAIVEVLVIHAIRVVVTTVPPLHDDISLHQHNNRGDGIFRARSGCCHNVEA